MGNAVEFDALKGAVITGVERLADEVVLFKFAVGPDWRMYHDQDCCESVELEFMPDFSPIIGKPLCCVSAVVMSGESRGESFTITRYLFEASGLADDVSMVWYGTSNGYYSEEVDFRPMGEGANS